ncbi:MAG TPA: hypothetical protein DDY52_05800 [Candidatus Moranbacteria bacterium]|nr:MAG: hypothetical protein UR51_C0002G0115 [Candidatus Moranbacteria bacterium GW2011_GWF1_34_10]HBI17622.1 hypothetical protein [Candidatus Moranbacteria bacterium]
MLNKFKDKYKIESSRLKGYDYSQNGVYFITICLKDRKHSFGKIVNEKMILGEIGKITQKFWQEIPNHFPFVTLDEYQIMPDHLHGIIEISCNQINTVETQHCCVSKSNTFYQIKSGSLPVIIRSFKSIVTKTVNINFSNLKFNWQSGFYDRIIRNEIELNKIREYIQNNPKMWRENEENIIENIFKPE